MNAATLSGDGDYVWAATDEDGAMRLRVWSVARHSVERAYEVAAAAWSPLPVAMRACPRVK